MSRRPTTKIRRNASPSVSAPKGYAVIGDSAAAVLYIKRLLGNNIATPVTLITQGVDRTSENGIRDIEFPVCKSKRILHYLRPEQIHMIPHGDVTCEDDDNDSGTDLENIDTDKVLQYYVGSGPLGDSISAYSTAYVGPWFQHSSDNYLERFLNEHTIQSCLNKQESNIVNKISDFFDIPKTSSAIVKGPSVMRVHRSFRDLSGDNYRRELFLHQYHNINQHHNVDIASEVSNLKFEAIEGSPYFNITGSGGLNLKSVKPVWKLNPYTYLHLATKGNYDTNAELHLPSFYRARLSIPMINGDAGENFSKIDLTPDLIATHVEFSLHDLNNPKHSGLTWLIQAYTTPEDLSVVEQEGRYADNCRILLIVEALCTKNRRRASFDPAENETQVLYNERLVEYNYLYSFAKIVAELYHIHTGATTTPEKLIEDESVCTPQGTCQDGNAVVDYATRESPMVTTIQLVSHLYGGDVFPNLNCKCC